MAAKRVRLAARRACLQHRAFEAALQARELLERAALDLGAGGEHAVGLLGPAGLAQGGGDGREDHAARLRHALAEPVDGAPAGALRLVEAPEREQRLHVDHDGHGEQVRVGISARQQQVDRAFGVRERVVGAPGAQPDLGSGAAEDGEREAVVRRERLGRGQRRGDLPLGAVDVALLHREVREVVAGHRLVPRVPGGDRQPQHLVQPRVPVADADVAEHDAGVAPGEDAQAEVADTVGELDRPLRLHERLGVRAGEEVQLALDRRQLGARRVVLGVRLGLGRQRDPALQVAALERNRSLQHQRPAAEHRIVEYTRDLVAPERLAERRLMILVMPVACAIQRTVELDPLARGHQHDVRALLRST